jgi:membrane protease subunit (stomatin/prohibitin family)
MDYELEIKNLEDKKLSAQQTAQEDIAGLTEKIGQLNSEIAARKAKLDELLGECDREIGALKERQSEEQSKPQHQTNDSQPACGSCGNLYTLGQDKFCMKCGNRLPENVLPPPVCGQCSTEFNPETDIFCKQCGNKLRA